MWIHGFCIFYDSSSLTVFFSLFFLIFSPPTQTSTRSFMIQVCVGWFNHQIGETQLVGDGYSWRLGNLVTVAQLPWRAMEMEMAMAAVWGEPRKVAGIFLLKRWVKGKSRFWDLGWMHCSFVVLSFCDAGFRATKSAGFLLGEIGASSM